MHKEDFTRVLFQKRQWLFRTLIFVFAIIYSSGFLLYPSQAFADAIPGGNVADSTVRAIDIDKPAIVRIITTLGGRITVHFPTTPSVSATFPQNGGTYSLQLSGSGAFISAHGDILTADHVINPPHDQSMNQYLQQLAAQDIADYVNQHFQPSNGGTYTSNDVIGALQSSYFLSDTHYSTPTSDVYLSTDYTGPLNASKLVNLPASTHAKVDRIEKDSPFDQKDVAIIHVTMADMPFIRIGDSSNVAQQDTLTIIGFPGNGDVSGKNDPTTLLTASVNKIFVSAIKRTDTGAPVIQVGGNVEHGDSGGPGLDNSGNIVGIVSFGGSDMPAGTSFLHASASAQELIDGLSLDTKSGAFDKTWRSAFSDYTSTAPGHWQKAQKGFQQLYDTYPQFHGALQFLTYSTTQAKHEKQASAASQPSPLTILGIVAFVVILLLIGLGVLLFVVTRRRKPAYSPATAQGGLLQGSTNTPAVSAYPPQQYNSSPERFAQSGQSWPPPQYAQSGQSWPPPQQAHSGQTWPSAQPSQPQSPVWPPAQPLQNQTPVWPPVQPAQPQPPVWPPARPEQRDAVALSAMETENSDALPIPAWVPELPAQPAKSQTPEAQPYAPLNQANADNNQASNPAPNGQPLETNQGDTTLRYNRPAYPPQKPIIDNRQGEQLANAPAETHSADQQENAPAIDQKWTESSNN